MAQNFSLCLLRHGATSWNEEGRYLSRTDQGIATEGRGALAKAVPGVAWFDPDSVILSPALRARETYEELRHLQAVRDVPVSIDPDARELDFGRFEGRTRSEIARSAEAEDFRKWLEPEFNYPGAPGGESFTSAAARAQAVLSRLNPGRTLLISHGYFLKILLATTTVGARGEDIRGLHLPNAVPILLTKRPEGWVRSDVSGSRLPTNRISTR